MDAITGITGFIGGGLGYILPFLLVLTVVVFVHESGHFWVGRLFRLYPLYLSVLAAVLILHYGFDKYPLPQAYLDHPVKATVVNATMLQNFVLGPQYLAYYRRDFHPWQHDDRALLAEAKQALQKALDARRPREEAAQAA